MKTKNFFLSATVLSVILVTVSCISNTAESDNPVSIVQVGDVTFKATHLSPDELIKRHGKENNPYVGRPKGFAFDTVIFEIEITSTETVLMFNLTDCQIKVEGNSESADNRMRFMTDWENYTKTAGTRQLGDYYAMKHLVNQTMFPNQVKVEPGKPVKGYIAFTGMFPRGLGETTIKIPAYTAGGDEGEVKIDFVLKEQKLQKSLFGINEKEKEKTPEKEKPENSIFDKQETKPQNEESTENNDLDLD